MSVLCMPIQPASPESPSGNPIASQSEKCNNLSYRFLTFLEPLWEAFFFNWILALNQFMPSHLLTSRPFTCWGSQPRTGKQSAPTWFCHFGNTHTHTLGVTAVSVFVIRLEASQVVSRVAGKSTKNHHLLIFPAFIATLLQLCGISFCMANILCTLQIKDWSHTSSLLTTTTQLSDNQF